MMANTDISIVVIGFNESAHLDACLQSAVAARDAGQAIEVIYADGGSTDDSVAIAERCGVDAVLGGTVRRSAAANRNAGWLEARGALIQFLDGDMTLEPDWLPAGTARLDADPNCAAVCGVVTERRRSIWSRAMQLDWRREPGPIRYFGGAALVRRTALEAVGGFPEDVAYGEEPLLCWRIRNDLGNTIEFLDAPMVTHDLAFGGLGDYWWRCTRVGETRAAIAARTWNTPDPMWRQEMLSPLGWVLAMAIGVVALALGPWPVRLTVVAAAMLLLARKMLQTLARGESVAVAAVYAVHTYLAKIPAALGVSNWWLSRRGPS
jgi:glycosyltransferase involved in cell wall biosynthesis